MSRLFAFGRPKPTTPATVDPLLEFDSETAPVAAPAVAVKPRATATAPIKKKTGTTALPAAVWPIAAGVALVAVAGTASAYWVRARRSVAPAAVEQPGKLTVDTRPAGAEILKIGRAHV